MLVEQNDAFYSIKGELSIYGITYDLQDLHILFDHFILIKSTSTLSKINFTSS
ncbi:hypothetical protein KUH03_27200 [Sphingobacterium sp. E70]|uniref:hypothetical protein n=1 Tax=Sphingobacterium sp. E70 TaxID=2853439 RepID=UPI00211B92CE|nr:hypothetical protein [Sphingobacterium sp. E70]ULT22936.1 hypothetical protein KUH03_27200 [Sphingobacterium sp. E70]